MQKPRPTCRPLDQVSSCRFTHSALLQTCNRRETSAAVDFTATLMPVRHCCEFLSHEYFITGEVIPILFQHQLNCSFLGFFFFLPGCHYFAADVTAGGYPLKLPTDINGLGRKCFYCREKQQQNKYHPSPPTNPACYISDLVVTGAIFVS